MLRDLAAFVFVVMPAQAQEPQPANAAAEPTVVLEGCVVDLRGEPVPLASISVVTWRDPEHVLARSVCDGEGCFRVGKIPKRDSWQVLAISEGRCQGQAFVWDGPEPVLVEVHDAASLRGVLHNRAGQPVAGAIVRAELVARILHGAHADATTDDEGRFVLQGVPLGFVRVAAVVPGEGLAVQRQLFAGDAQIAVAPGDDPTTSLRIEVEGLPESALPQLSASILPYANARIEHFPPPWDKPVFDKAGRCELLRVPDLEYLVSPSSADFAFAPRELRVKQGKGPHVLCFAASQRGSEALQCKATLKGPDGSALAGVPLVMRASDRRDGAEATSAADGSLTFASPLAAGSKAIVYSLDDRWVLDQPKGEDTFGARDRRFLVNHECTVDPATTLELRVVPACTVTGRMLLGDGRPAAFVSVQLENERTERIRWMPFARATTDRAGNYRFPRCHHLDEAVRIKVEGRSGSAASEGFGIARAGATVEVPELKLAPPATIEGIVCDAQQKPAPGIRVWLRDWDFAKNAMRSGSLVEVITDRQGRYRFLGAPPGGAWLQLLSDGEDPTKSAVEPFEVEAGKTYTHDLQLSRQ